MKTWNAPQIAKLNPSVTLPSLPIQVVNRPAGKGSNYVFTDFLSKAIPSFAAQVGVTASPKWPVGAAAERSSDMADKVKNSSRFYRLRRVSICGEEWHCPSCGLEFLRQVR